MGMLHRVSAVLSKAVGGGGESRHMLYVSHMNEAGDFYTRAINHCEEDADLHYLRSHSYFWADRFAEAATSYQRGLELHPDDSRFVKGLAYAHYRAGNLEQAADSFQKLVEVQPGTAAHIYYALVLTRLGLQEEAERQRSLYREVNSPHWDTTKEELFEELVDKLGTMELERAARDLIDQSKFDEAIELLEEAKALASSMLSDPKYGSVAKFLHDRLYRRILRAEAKRRRTGGEKQ